MRIINCERKPPKRHRITLSITVDPHILESLKKWMAREGETNLSSVIEGFVDCGIRDSCEGCPSYEELPDDEKKTVGEKAGVGKWGTK